MLTDAIDHPAWDLSDPTSMRVRFTPQSFYIVIDGLSSTTVRHTANLIKTSFLVDPAIRVRGPLALPTVRRRHMVMREMRDGDSKGLYISRPKRYRHILLVIHPTAASIAGLIALSLPQSVNIKIEPYQNQFDLKDDR